jgi:hypothetical protein
LVADGVTFQGTASTARVALIHGTSSVIRNCTFQNVQLELSSNANGTIIENSLIDGAGVHSYCVNPTYS